MSAEEKDRELQLLEIIMRHANELGFHSVLLHTPAGDDSQVEGIALGTENFIKLLNTPLPITYYKK